MRKPATPAILLAFFVAAGTVVAACVDINTSPTAILSIEFDTLASPSVVVGDTLRDTTGTVAIPVVHAFNFKGEEIPAPPIFFLSPDSGITVDSLTGIVVADSLRSTPARVIASVGPLQAVQNVDVTLRPDLLVAVNAVDSLQYSPIDSTLNVSVPLQVKLTHGIAPNDSVVKSYIVSFAIVEQSNPQLGQLVNDGGKPSVVDTTDASGLAGRKIRIRAVNITAPRDSIVVNATAKYRGVEISGSPVRLVLLLKPPI
jgi:hypothetical protein